MSKKKAFVRELTKLLQNKNLVSIEDSFELQNDFSRKSKETYDNFLLSEGIVQKDDLLEVLSEYYKVPYFDTTGYFFKQVLLHQFPKSFLLQNAIIPVEHDGDILIVVASDPRDEELLSKMGQYVSYEIRFRVGLYRDITRAVREFYEGSPSLPASEEDQEAKSD